MQGTKSLEAPTERITKCPGQVLSLYVNVNPDRAENLGRAYVLRLKFTFKDKRGLKASGLCG
jgi:hypothetical protein